MSPAAKKSPPAPAKRKLQIHPYLCFAGRCEEAAEFYRRTLDAEVVTLMRVKDCPPSPDGGPGPQIPGEQVLHMSLQIGEATLMGTDCSFGAPTGFQNFSLTLQVADPAEAERRFAALAEGGQPRQPLSQTFFSPSFGIVADKFGVSWMIMAAP